MRPPAGTIILAVCVILAIGSNQPAHAKRLAYSKNYGVEIFAEEKNNAWCREKLDLRLNGDNESSFETDRLQTLISKLGNIIKKECPEATSANVNGYYNDKLAYRARISEQENWMLRAIPGDSGKPAGETTVAPVEAATEPAHTTVDAENSKLASTTPSAVIAASGIPTSQPSAPPTALQVETPVMQARAPGNFMINGWKPGGRDQSIKLSGGATEHIIRTRDDSCGIRYTQLRDESLLEFLHLDLKEVDCKNGLVHGKGSATIKRSDGQLVATFKGHFRQGYPLGIDLADSWILSRYISNRNNDSLSVFLNSDVEKKVHFIGHLHGNRGTWGNCSSMLVTAATVNENAFLDIETIKPAIQRAGELARELCPNIRQIEFIASRIPDLVKGSGTDVQHFHTYATRYRNKDSWEYNAAQAQNHVINRRMATAKAEKQRAAREEAQRVQLAQQEQQRKNQLSRQLEGDLNRLQTASRADRVAYRHGAYKLTNPLHAAARSIISDNPVFVTVLLNISDADGDMAEVDEPATIMLTATDIQLEDEGWHIISGNLTADGSTDKTGLLIPSIAVTKLTRCDDDRCREVDDVDNLVNARARENGLDISK